MEVVVHQKPPAKTLLQKKVGLSEVRTGPGTEGVELPLEPSIVCSFYEQITAEYKLVNLC